jgi:hypothetical protein
LELTYMKINGENEPREEYPQPRIIKRTFPAFI